MATYSKSYTKKYGSWGFLMCGEDHELSPFTKRVTQVIYPTSGQSPRCLLSTKSILAF
jgi:hypothetical protein